MTETTTCPRCSGSGRSVWVQPGGATVEIRCGACRGSGAVSVAEAARVRKTRRTLTPAPAAPATQEDR